MALQGKILNLPQFESQLSGGMKRLSGAAFKELKQDARKFFNGVAKKVEGDSRYQALRTDEALRGKLGLARPGMRFGSDTDAEDLLKILKRFTVKAQSTPGSRKFVVSFPSLSTLEKKLMHNLSRVKAGALQRGPRQSWFRWWEFGDRGEIDTLTVLRTNISQMASQGTRGNSQSRKKLLEIIDKKSRSGFAIQLRNKAPGGSSHISPAGLIQEVYRNYGRIFPARMGKTLTNFLRRSGGIGKFFARSNFR